MQILQPPGWAEPKGYANGILAQGELVFVAGQVGWDETGTFRVQDFVGQVRQCLENTLAVLSEAGMLAEIVRDPTQVLDKLRVFNPDLVLMDMYLPKCAGDELARLELIRAGRRAGDDVRDAISQRQ